MELALLPGPIPDPTAELPRATDPVEVPIAPRDAVPMGAMLVGGITVNVVGGATTPPFGGVPREPSSRCYKHKYLSQCTEYLTTLLRTIHILHYSIEKVLGYQATLIVGRHS